MIVLELIEREFSEVAYENEAESGDNSHENAAAFSQGKSIELNERLWCIKREEEIQVWGTEKEEDGGSESEDTGGYYTGHDATTSDNTRQTHLSEGP